MLEENVQSHALTNEERPITTSPTPPPAANRSEHRDRRGKKNARHEIMYDKKGNRTGGGYLVGGFRGARVCANCVSWMQIHYNGTHTCGDVGAHHSTAPTHPSMGHHFLRYRRGVQSVYAFTTSYKVVTDRKTPRETVCKWCSSPPTDRHRHDHTVVHCNIFDRP